MSNEKLAREWAKTIRDAVDQNPTKFNEKARAAADYILANVPEPTMADVEWSDEKHHLAGATMKRAFSESSVEVVMQFDRNDVFIDYTTLGGEHGMVERRDLTPNGKKYELREVTGDDHPETLTTVEDYENAPEGTIVASDGYLSTPLVKRYGKWCRDRIEFTAEDLDAVAEQLRVLRWGWGE